MPSFGLPLFINTYFTTYLIDTDTALKKTKRQHVTYVNFGYTLNRQKERSHIPIEKEI